MIEQTEVYVAAVGVIFGAGGFYAVTVFRAKWTEEKNEESAARLKSQIDGVGNKMRLDAMVRDTQYRRMAGCLILEAAARLVTEEKKLAQLENIVRRLLMD